MECVSRNPGGAREACGSESEIGGGRGNVDTTRATGFRTSNLVREGSTVSERHTRRSRCTREALRPAIECYSLKTSRTPRVGRARNRIASVRGSEGKWV
ncbi:hypothetical protein VUR80DRAFT_1173 [Thermomyces stellatus]